MYILTVEDSFSSAHQLRGYQGKCENLHGHNWKVELNIQGKELDNIGLLLDFTEIKRMLKEVMNFLDHKNLNDLPPFDKINPSSENIARFIAEKIEISLRETLTDTEVESVIVWESEKSRCKYIPEKK